MRQRTSASAVPGALLRFPLHYKILVANAAIVALVGLMVGLVARAGASDMGGAGVAIIMVAGIVVSVFSNMVILRLALDPLRRLERTAARVQAGDMEARVEPSSLADRDLERLMTTFNRMLDSNAANRRRQRTAAARSLSAMEEERKRIARELHDGVAQNLAALRIRLRVARAAPDEAARQTMLDQIGTDIGAAMEEMRQIARGLRPPALDVLGLAPAIELHARTVAEAASLELESDLAAVDSLLAPAAELALYRVVQEALSNVVRHANARCVSVRLEAREGRVMASVTDDGRGFHALPDPAATGLGLFGMQERAAHLGGRVEIASEPGRGTRVLITIPTGEGVPDV